MCHDSQRACYAKILKISRMVILHSKFNSELIFENFNLSTSGISKRVPE